MRCIFALGFACLAAACSDSDANDVTEPIDGANDSIGVFPDASFQCANDSSIEPNEDPQSAFVTPVESVFSDFNLVGLAICPPSDVDQYRFDIVTSGHNFEATVSGTAGRTTLSASILDASGTAIAIGAPVAGSPHVLRVELTAPAVGAYTVRVRSADATENNYDLQLRTCAAPLPCP